ncbi:hypothetical protein GCM10027258_71450 [Amycolatopsis stemonae]
MASRRNCSGYFDLRDTRTSSLQTTVWNQGVRPQGATPRVIGEASRVIGGTTRVMPFGARGLAAEGDQVVGVDYFAALFRGEFVR